MKWTAFFILAACLQVSARGYAQRINISAHNVTLDAVFKEIEHQSNYYFVYRDEWLHATAKVDVSIQNATIEEALKLCFKNQPFSYAIVGKTIVLKPQENAPETVASQPPPGDIKGYVAGDNGPLYAATVINKRTGTGTATNLRGEFTLSDVNENDVLIISSIGYEKQEISLKDKKGVISVQLKVAVNKLDEVQVLAYGQTTSQRINTGTVTKVTAADIAKQPVTNVLQVLAGQVPGMLITENSGTPGAGIKVQIRAAASLPSINNVAATGTAPLYIIDGVSFLSEPVYSAGGNTKGFLQPSFGSSPLNTMNPGDIESIEVLKDADATAIYGSRGANGVILITTKKGKAGKTKLDVNVNSGISMVSDLHKVHNMTTAQYLEVRHQAFDNSNLTPTASTAPDLVLWDTTKTTDFAKTLIGRTAHLTDAAVSFSGGNFQTNFLLSGTYHKETTVIPGDYKYGRGAVHLSVEHTSPDRKFMANISATMTVDKNNNTARLGYSTDLASVAFSMAPDFPLYDSTGKNLYWFDLNTYSLAYDNPLKYKYDRYTAKTNNLIGNIMLKYTPVHGLNLKVSTSYNKLLTDAQSQVSSLSLNPFNTTYLPYSYFQQNYAETWNVEPQADYTHKIGDGTLNVLVGSTLQNNSYVQPFYISANHYTSDALLGSVAAAGSIYVTNFSSEYKYQSVFGRANYNWLNKYIVNINYRYDGSSKFGVNNRFGSFGSVGAAWIFSEENLIKNKLSFLSYGKLRGSYGSSGNDQIPNYQYLSTYQTTYYGYNGISGLVPSKIANPNLKWEVNKKSEVALDLGFLKDRILVSGTWYVNNTNNPLVSNPLSTVSGFSSYYANLPALIRRKGLEFTLSTQNIKNKNFSWNTSINISFAQSKLVSFPTIANTGYINYMVVGQSMSTIYAWHYTGLSATTGLPTVLDANKNGTTLLSEDGLAANGLGDKIAVGKSDPDYFGGMNNSFRYKGFSLDVLLQFVGHATKQSIDYGSTTPPGYDATNKSSYIYDLFKQTNGKIATKTFGYNTDGSAYNSYVKYSQSDALLSNGAYWRVKNVSLSYTFSESWLKHIKMSAAQLYLQGQNLFTGTKFRGFDPESPAGNIPPLKTFTAGVKFSF
ncbi:SusC/RagA family TonB-linked outer membrane protein [Chitinophaga costaii]|nr:SusC/RagA family TonB-linked outer membrane protein [Chitinophaga costaii]